LAAEPRCPRLLAAVVLAFDDAGKEHAIDA